MSSASSVAQVVAALERRYPLSSAEPWDAVGLVCGDPQAAVQRILWAVDPVEPIVDQAIELEVDLLVTHHPLFLAGVHSVAADSAKGRVVHRLINAGIALYCAHTNADVASPGVSDALAAALGLVDVRPLASDTSLGRLGVLPEAMRLGDVAERVVASLPPTHHGARILGDPDAVVSTVAVCGGSGDFLLAAVTAAGADVYVTADLKHHRALEHREDGGCAVIDVAHWASEWPWLAQAAALLADDLPGTTVESLVSEIPTDPWDSAVRSPS